VKPLTISEPASCAWEEWDWLKRAYLSTIKLLKRGDKMNHLRTPVVFLALVALGIGLQAIDPAEASTVILNPINDTYVDQEHPDTPHNGVNNGQNLWVNGKTGEIEHAYLMFDVSSIPVGSIITSAVLSLYLTDFRHDSSQDVHHVADDSWSQSTVTWNNMPAFDVAVLGTATRPSLVSTWEVWDLLANSNWTYAVDLADQRLSLLIKNSVEGVLGYEKYSSYDSGSNVPKLEITYDLNPVPLPPSLWLLASGLIGLIGLKNRFLR
jgi:hypothetical protein